MTNIRPFLFEVDFDPRAKPAKPAPAKDAKPAPPPEPTYTAKELAQAKSQAFKEGEKAGRDAGQKAGRAEAEKQAAARLAQALDRIAKGVTSLVRERDALNDMRRAQPLALAMVIVKKLMPTLAERHGVAEIEALVTTCLADLIDEPRLAIRVPTAGADELRERIEATPEAAGFAGRLVVRADGTLGPADCRVEWADGGAERNTDQLIAEIERVIDHNLAQP